MVRVHATLQNSKCVLVRSDNRQRQGLGRQNAFDPTHSAVVAQLVERCLAKAEVRGFESRLLLKYAGMVFNG